MEKKNNERAKCVIGSLLYYGKYYSAVIKMPHLCNSIKPGFSVFTPYTYTPHLPVIYIIFKRIILILHMLWCFLQICLVPMFLPQWIWWTVALYPPSPKPFKFKVSVLTTLPWNTIPAYYPLYSSHNVCFVLLTQIFGASEMLSCALLRPTKEAFFGFLCE